MRHIIPTWHVQYLTHSALSMPCFPVFRQILSTWLFWFIHPPTEKSYLNSTYIYSPLINSLFKKLNLKFNSHYRKIWFKIWRFLSISVIIRWIWLQKGSSFSLLNGHNTVDTCLLLSIVRPEKHVYFTKRKRKRKNKTS